MKKRLYVIAIIIALLLSTLMVTVQAADLNCTVSMKSISEKVEKGKEFTVTIDVSDINAGKKGINSIKGTLEFDDKVFEEITADSIEGSNDWNATYSKDSGKVTLLKTSFVKEDEEVCQINLKVKAKTTTTKGTIEFKDIVASNSESEVPAEDVSIDVEIGVEIGVEEDNNNKNENKNKNNTITITSNKNINKNNANTNKNLNTNKNTNTNKNLDSNNKATNNVNKNINNSNVTNQTTEEMPDTGIDDTIVKAIILVALVGAVGYIKMKSLEQR